MTIFTGLITGFSRLMGNVATMTVGWATVLLFGRVSQAKQSLLSFIALGSLAWVVALVGVLVPTVGAFVLALIPRPAFVPLEWLGWVMLAIAILLPLAIGLATVFIVAPGSRAHGSALAWQILRGYACAAVLAVTIIFLAALSLVRQVRSLQKGWNSDRLAVIIKAGRYGAVVSDIESALHEADLKVVRKRAPRSLEIPPRLLAVVGGNGVKELIPDELVEFNLDGLGILIYPSDIALLGPKELVARARAAIARRLTFADVYLTSATESQQIEDRLTEISRADHVSAADFRPIDELLTTLVVPYDDWETLYRLRLQVEHEARLPGATGPADGS